MEGMQVHHRILSSEGGSNDPANLYVCSPEYHAKVWHNGDQFSIWALKGAKAGTEAQKQGRSRGGRAAAPTQTKEAARKTGLANKGRKLKTTHNNQAAVTNSQKWRCLVTGKTSTSGPLTRYQNKRGIDTSLRERIS